MPETNALTSPDELDALLRQNLPEIRKAVMEGLAAGRVELLPFPTKPSETKLALQEVLARARIALIARAASEIS